MASTSPSARRRVDLRRIADHMVLCVAATIMGGPLLLLFAGATDPGGLRGGLDWSATQAWQGFEANLARLASLNDRGSAVPTAGQMFRTSLLVGLGVASLSCAVAFLSAYSLTVLPRRGARLWFSVTILTLYFPVEARMLPTFDVALRLGLINSLPGLILPVLPLAVAMIIFVQHLKTLPPSLLEAARVDGAGPLKFLWDFALPLSWVPICAVFIVTFLIGWNQYLWPIMISIDNSHFPLMRGLNLVGSGSGPSMMLAVLSVLPPLVLVLAFLRLLSRVTSVHL